ncbi:hypothetical protein Tco_0866991 [Tanacetum coccineum]
MSSASSTVTYTSVYIDSGPGRVFWGADEEISDGGSPRVIVYGYDRLPIQPPLDPDNVPEPIYPEYIPLEDEHEVLAEEQPLPPVVSPTVESLGYVVESDPEEDLEEYEDDETEDGLVDYPIDGGDDGDDDDGDSSGDDADDEDEDERDEDDEDEEEEEHLVLANSVVIVSTASISLPPEAEVKRLLAMPTPPPSPPISLSPPSAGERLARYEIGESSTARPTKGRGVDYEFVSTVDAEAIRQGISEVGYGIRDTWVDPAEAVYLRMTLQETVWIMEEEAYASREAWAHSIRLSQGTHQELQTYHDHVYAHDTYIQAHQAQLQLQSTLIQTQHQMVETLRVMRDMRVDECLAGRVASNMREQQRRARQPGPDARIPDHQDASRDADRHI